ncbi:MAG: CDP-diacylglycerol--serine O-phosphatidyltransferase [Verrucomicrobiia bacterium Tous-C3TDCM]|nr:MAG: CDP-diacylglycerol--serine O-phosphatidyltransferase [Verrucomicrobiae bacterium Tous-C3TDCM]PAZ05823.1 MAG: CDP-diacylglycerol--serine O-phosphatidyltransferase [Verrucomicrobiae bacterium AMD-G2]
MTMKDDDELKIPLLPNLMTAGNLCCGFLAVLSIFYGVMEASKSGTYDFLLAKKYYETAIMLIFGSCIFDLLDGRMARLTGQDSPFGREFDSLADIVSFGMAPAMLMAKAVLFPLPNNVGWGIALLYLLCGAMRLARFNCLAVMPKKPGDNGDFMGIPIPMAAGFIASLTILIINVQENDRELGLWKYVLAAAMFGISLLMMSKVRYPSFKKVDFRTKGSIWSVVAIVLVLVLLVRYRYQAPVVLFSLYLVYGLVRPLISKRLQKDIEWDDDEEPENIEEKPERE